MSVEKIGNLEVHALAGIVPMANEEQQLALQNDIRDNGQKQKIVLYKGKILDGRCRATACEKLGVYVERENLPHNTTLVEAKKYVKSVNTRRDLTSTQRAISAYRAWKDDPSNPQKYYYDAWSINNKLFQAAKELDALNADWLEHLFNDGKIKVGITYKNSYGKMVQKKSNSIPTVRDHAQKLYQEMKQVLLKAPDKIPASTFDERVNASHIDVRASFNKNIANLHIEDYKTINGEPMSIVPTKNIKELCLHDAQLTHTPV